MRPWPALCAVATILAAGCVRPYEIWPDPAATIEHPLFHLGRRNGGSPTKEIGEIRFTPCFGAKYATDQQAAWIIVSSNGEHDLSTLTYGETPAGFVTRVPAKPLQGGACYVVRVGTPGYESAMVFRTTMDRRLVEVGEAERRASGDSALRRETAFGDTAVLRCRRRYADARSQGDTARVDAVAVTDSTGEFPPLDCAFLRSAAGGGLRLQDEMPR